MSELIFIFGDLHFPWHSRSALKAALSRLIELKPTHVVQIGDLYDMLSFSRFARSQNLITPQEERIRGRKFAEEFWCEVRRKAKKAKLYQITGNHDTRPIRQILDKAPEYEEMVSLNTKELLTFKGVKTIHDPREELYLKGITFIHGHHPKLGDHMMEAHENIVCGHSHRGGIIFHPWNGKIKWELNAGFLGDKDSKALSYTARKKFSKWTLGWGVVENGVPRFEGY